MRRPSQSSGHLLAAGIGQAAWETLSANQTGRVLGVTSRGLFVLTPTQHIVYVSFEQYRGRHIAFGRERVAISITEAAYRATTTIRANLIECAAAGQGDERLITVVDGIATGKASIDECVECVLGWGSSSGIDALAGMAVAVTAF